MKRWIGIAVMALAGLAVAGLLTAELANLTWMREQVAAGHADKLGTDAGELERSLEQALPMGTLRPVVEAELLRRKVKFHFDPGSRTITAGVRNLKGSNWLTQTGVEFELRFDQADKLTGLHAHAVNTSI